MPEIFWFAFGTVTGVVFVANVWWLVAIVVRATDSYRTFSAEVESLDSREEKIPIPSPPSLNVP